MKKVHVSFQFDEACPDIRVVFTASEEDEEVLSLMDRVRDPLERTLTVMDENGALVPLREDQIISISSDGKKLKVVAEDGTYELAAVLGKVEKELHPYAFFRISRFEIIHLGKVQKFDFSVSGTVRIEMKNGMQTWASRRYIPEIRNRLKRKEWQI